MVVDDHDMAITHIFRGEDWLPSTPKHLLIYKAFGWTVPPIAHFPNVLGADGKKLAKRHGATKVEQFRADGYLPEAMVNYLALIGWSPGTEEEVFSMDDLIAKWRIDQVQKAGGKWDRDRLDWFNGVWIRKLSDEDLVGRLDAFLPAEWDRNVIHDALPIMRERMRTLVEGVELVRFLFTDDAAYDPAALVPKKQERGAAARALARATAALRDTSPFAKPEIEAALRKVAEDLGGTSRMCRTSSAPRRCSARRPAAVRIARASRREARPRAPRTRRGDPGGGTGQCLASLVALALDSRRADPSRTRWNGRGARGAKGSSRSGSTIRTSSATRSRTRPPWPRRSRTSRSDSVRSIRIHVIPCSSR